MPFSDMNASRLDILSTYSVEFDLVVDIKSRKGVDEFIQMMFFLVVQGTMKGGISWNLFRFVITVKLGWQGQGYVRKNLVPRSPDVDKNNRKGVRKTFDPVHLHQWWWMRGPCAKDNHSEESQIEFFSGLAKADSSMSTPSQWKHLGKAGQASTPDQKIIHYNIKRKGSP